jgi:uncharacterized integral membrane protein (TIGR00697 family)
MDAVTLDRRTGLFVVLAALFVTCLVVGDLIGVKLTDVGVLGRTFTISLGMIPFPVTFLLTDLLNEFYGKARARFVTLVGFAMALLTLALVTVADAVPIAPFTREPGWTGVTEAQFSSVFAGSQRILVASMVAYLVGQLLDISVFHALKRLTRSRLLWLRATGSTLVSQLVDTVFVQFLAWSGTLPTEKILEIVASSYTFKVMVAVGLTPVIYAGHALVERWFGLHPLPVEGAEPAPGGA